MQESIERFSRSNHQVSVPFLLVDKPSGVTTHTSHGNESRWVDIDDGFQEHLERRLDMKLFVVHRLDRDTSGALVYATSPEAAEHLRRKFEAREIEKTYVFLTDRKADFKKTVYRSVIEKVAGKYTSSPIAKADLAPRSNGSSESVTDFELLKDSHGLFLWQAMPKTGRTHQIRLHASALGIPILGDRTYGGSDFPQLCLHSEKISFHGLQEEKIDHASPRPVWFDETDLAGDWQYSRWFAAIDRRLRLLRSLALKPDALQTIRWIHDEGDPLRVDQLGSTVWMSWYDDKPPEEIDLEQIREVARRMNWRSWILTTRLDRGKTPNEAPVVLSDDEVPSRWIGKETSLSKDLNYEFRRDSGLSSGLFLDQRANRRWVHANSHGKTVLNLFAYTGGFSVAAAAGGASKTTSVDISRSFLDWSKQNFSINELDPTQNDFRPMDARDYLSWAKKKALSFDLVICDPPSFARGPSGPFRIEKDFAILLEQCLSAVAQNGKLLFALNFEKWSMAELISRVQKVLVELGENRYALEPAPGSDWDFELPGNTKMMKSFIVARK
jgi:23S rRNA (cytosine1962-C5)-methyltransferase